MNAEDAVVTRLRSAFGAADPVPHHALDAALASLSWRDPDSALAELVGDSLTDPAGVRNRSDTGPRLLTFEGDHLVVEVEVSDLGGAHRLLGQLVPPQPAEVEVRWRGGSLRAAADQLGRFRAASVPPGPISISCRLTEPSRLVSTSWVTV
ncbi:MAG: hypothetical protein GEV10_03035 [Streptosporangiales bacterium]|nr:hypothetical protein [Streptosporangiales bacterium]